MEVWIVENGEKRGPFQTYELRDRIEKEELMGEELAWHKDQDGWVALKEMEVFRSEFEDRLLRVQTPPPLPTQPHVIVRFFARWFDIMLYHLLVFTLLRVTGQNILTAIQADSWFAYVSFLPFVVFEAACLHFYKTTPGKFFLGIRVVTQEEGAVPFRVALFRSLRVYIVGMGLFMYILPFVCHAFCLWYTLKNKEAPWDTLSGVKVRVTGPFLFPVLIFVMLFIMIMILMSIVLLPTVFELQARLEEQASGS